MDIGGAIVNERKPMTTATEERRKAFKKAETETKKLARQLANGRLDPPKLLRVLRSGL